MTTVSMRNSSQGNGENRANIDSNYESLPYVDCKPMNLSKNSFDDVIYTKNIVKTYKDKISLQGLDKCAQEKLIFEDLCHCLVGIDGKYILHFPHKTSGIDFMVDQYIDQTLKEFTNQLLEFAKSFNILSKFVDEAPYSSKSSPLTMCFANSMRPLIQEYMSQIAECLDLFQIGKYSLHQLWYEIRHKYSHFVLLAKIIQRLSKTKYSGIELINYLYSELMNQLAELQNLSQIQIVLEELADFYLIHVQEWMCTGTTPDDALPEFFISKSKTMGQSNFSEDFLQSHWQEYFQLNLKIVPDFLKQSAELIFKTGKFSYTMRQTQFDTSQVLTSLKYSFLGKDIYSQIHEYHLNLSKSFIKFMSDNMKLQEHLRVLRNTFLIGKAKFITDFLKHSEEELLKDSDDIVVSKLESFFDFSLQSSLRDKNSNFYSKLTVSLETEKFSEMCLKILDSNTNPKGSDPNKDETENYSSSLISGYEALCLEYSVNWPLSVIINQKVIFQFKILFRFLLQWKLCEMNIIRVIHELTKKDERFEFFTFALKIVQNFLDYFQTDVIDEQMELMTKSLNKSTTLEEISQNLSSYMQSMIQLLFIDNKFVMKRVIEFLSAVTNSLDHAEDDQKKDTQQVFGISYANLIKSLKECPDKSIVRRLVNRLNCV